VDGDLFQVEDIDQHTLVVGRDFLAAGLIHHGAQLVLAQGVVPAVGAVDPHQGQQAVGETVDQPDHRVEHFHQRLEHPAGGKGNALGADGRQGLGGDLGKYQRDDGEEDAGEDFRAGAKQVDGNGGGDDGGKVVGQVVADKDNPDQAIGSVQQL